MRIAEGREGVSLGVSGRGVKVRVRSEMFAGINEHRFSHLAFIRLAGDLQNMKCEH